ncbi:monocarboxylate transporter 5-like [Littorina saxatilis]|uniref:monocarboxylate transporter 5-like n=1 Tax=Littorina saxatilis TaxID=31220 RepID=UPI0038B65B0C
MGKGKHGGEGPKKGQEGYVPPPDGGWGWVVVFSSFLIHVIADGIVYSFGVFLMVFVDHFKSGRGETSWVGSLQPAVTFTVGPLASSLTNRYGCRKVTIVGAFICATGFVISVFAPNLYYLYFSSGIMAGLGFGLIYLPAIVSVAQYFEKRRAFATGLAVCGSGFGTFVMAPLTEFLLQEYGWRGAMLILGGVILNVVVCGAVFRPLVGSPVPEEEDNVENGNEEGEKDKEKGEGSNSNKLSPEKKALLNPLVNGNSPRGEPTKIKLNDIDIVMEISLDHKVAGDANTLPIRPVPLEWNSQQQLSPVSNGPCSQDIASIAKSDGALHRINRMSPEARKVRSLSRQHSQSPGAALTVIQRPVGRKDVFYTASLQNIPMFNSHHDMYITSITSLPDATEEEEEEDYKCCGIFTVPSDFRQAFREMMDFSLLRNPVFLMFAISNFFTSIGFNMPFIFLPDRAKLSGIDEVRAAWLLSAIGIANTLGRVVFGFMADLKWVNRLMLYNTALTICGVATALSPFVGGSYELLMLYAAVFGIFIGVYVSLTSVVLVDLLGIDLLTNSFGLLLLFQGAATFIGPPLAGWMCDWTGSYDISFNVMGSLIAVSGIMLFFLPCVQRHYERNMPPDEKAHYLDMGALPADHESHHDLEEQIALRPRKTSL